MTKAEGKRNIELLVKQYDNNIPEWEKSTYKELETRGDFIDGFFEALGWKINGLPESMSLEDRDVKVEYALKNKTDDKSESTKSIDYIFKIGNKNQFLVEAKKPFESLAKPKHIFQAKTYGFTSGIPFAILTNFKEFKIFDISTKPNFKQINEDLIFSCTYHQYLEQFDYFWNNFSKEAVVGKSLIKLFSERRKDLDIDLLATDYTYILKKGEQLLDTVFLNDLNIMRIELAQNIIKNSKKRIPEKQLNDITQRLIDIIIFLRFLEDNDIEKVELLREIIKGKKNHLKLLMEECSKLNVKYNGLLFHEYIEFDKIVIDPQIFEKNILRLYYPESPYNFSKISIEILGRIFEQFLAKKIVIDCNNKVSLEIKPELIKAGGIYYTPEYIVDYILDNTLKRKLDEDSPNKDLKQSKIIDFSCGSGVFLIKAFKMLITYFENSNIDSKFLFKDSLGNRRLTMAAKKSILIENIYGIDIDSQAIEIVKMSLYFTMLENYSEEKSPRPILPSLEKNIICGNSIIDTTFFDGEDDIDIKTVEVINPFSWKDHKLGLFDVVVGNPPYLKIQHLEGLYPNNYQEYLKSNYAFPHSNFDLSIVFVEKGISILKPDALLGFIIPRTVLGAKYGEKFREIISDKKLLSKIVDFNDCQVFQNSTNYTCLLFLKNSKNIDFDFLNVANIENDFLEKKDLTYSNFDFKKLGSAPWFFSSSDIQNDFLKFLDSKSTPLKELENLEKIFVGLQPSVNDVFLLEMISEDDEIINCYSKATGKTHPFEKGLIKSFVKGSSNIFRYYFESNRKLLFPYKNDTASGESVLISPAVLKSTFPLSWEYLLLCKENLQKKGALIGKDFYKFIYKKNHLLFDNKKIMLPSLCYGSRFAFDKKGEYYFTGSGEGGGGGYGLLLNNTKSSFDYYNILGILNSSVISAIIEIKGSYKKGGYKGIDREFIFNIPLPKQTTKNQKEILKNISINTAKLNSITTVKPTAAVLTMISILDKKINELVFEIYEIKDQRFIDLINEVNA